MMSDDGVFTLRERLMRIIPFGLLIALVTLNLLFLGVRVVPQWASLEQIQQDMSTAQAAGTQMVVQLTADNNLNIVSLQLTHTAEQLNTSAALFLTQAQADATVLHLYTYAAVSHVEITQLQNQPSQVDPTVPYTMQMYRVQVVGDVPQLLNFIARIDELSRPGFLINDLAITASKTGAALTMGLQLYVLPGSSEYPLVIPLMTITPIATSAALSQDAPEIAITQTLDVLGTRLLNTSMTPSATITETATMISSPGLSPTQTPWIIMQTAQPQPIQPALPQALATQLVVVTQIQQVEVRIVVTATPSITPMPSLTPIVTNTSVPTFTPTASATLTPTPSETPTLTATSTETPTAALTETPTDVPL